MEMEQTVHLLRTWFTPEEVITNFFENEIGTERFKDLTDIYLKELCPHMGQRIQLKKNIQDYLDSVADTEPSSENIPSTLNNETCSNTNIEEVTEDNIQNISLGDITNFLFDNLNRPPLPEFDINTLLQTSAHGNSILNYYKKYKSLNAKKRNILVDIVVKHIYTYIVNNKLRKEDFNLIAAKIVTVFPCENVATYYMSAVPTSKSTNGKYIPAKGKLVDKVRNLLYVSGDRQRTPKSSRNQKNDDEQENLNLLDVSEDENVIWLKNNNAPWEEVIEKWKITLPLRTREENLPKVHDYLIKWPILKSPQGHVLINSDFQERFQGKSLNFFKNWRGFFEKLLKLKEEHMKNVTGLNLLETLHVITDEDKKIPVQMTLLGYLIPPKGRLNRKIKFSSCEAIEGLIVHTNNAGDIDTTITNQREKLKARKQSMQPYVLVQGRLHDFSAIYIVIDDVKYSFETASKAFDVLFKAYQVLHVKYPEAGEYLYLIIQRMIYGITTPFDQVPPHIVEILNLN